MKDVKEDATGPNRLVGSTIIIAFYIAIVLLGVFGLWLADVFQIEGGEMGWNAIPIWGFALAGVLATAAFLVATGYVIVREVSLKRSETGQEF